MKNPLLKIHPMEIFPLNIWYPIKWSLLHLKTYLNLFLVIRAIFTKKKSQCINALLQPRRTSDSLLALVHSSLVDYSAHVIYAKKLSHHHAKYQSVFP